MTTAAPSEQLQGRFFAALCPAFEKLEVFAAQATPRERARMFEPADHGRHLRVPHAWCSVGGEPPS